MCAEMSADVRRSSSDCPHMKIRRHAPAVIDGVIVPEEWLASKLFCDALQMARRVFARADFFACPEDLDGRIEQPPKVLQIICRSLAEKAVEHRIVAVV